MKQAIIAERLYEELQALHGDLQSPRARVEIIQAQINELWDIAVLLRVNRLLHQMDGSCP